MKLAILALLLLAGCASPGTWTKANLTQQEYLRDWWECERDMRIATGDGPYARPRMFGLCMQSRGYVRVD
jgi:hypothetical protein